MPRLSSLPSQARERGQRRRRLTATSALAAPLAALALLLMPAAAPALNLEVKNTKDSGPESLRAAIEASNLATDPDTIVITATGEIKLETQLPFTNSPLDIVGPGPEQLTVSRDPAAAAFGIFFFRGATLLSGMTISGGQAASGAGIEAGGPLTLTRVVVRGNKVTGGSGSRGAGISIPTPTSPRPLILRETLVTENVVENTRTAGQTFGGAIAAEDGGTIERSTIAGNRIEFPSATGAAEAAGAGISIVGGASEIRSSTIAGNSIVVNQAAQNPVLKGAGVFGEQSGGDVPMITGSTIANNSISASTPGQGSNVFNGLFRDTIVAGGVGGANCAGVVVGSFGFNLEDGTSCNFTNPTDLNTNPLLAPTLADNGGPTPTFALQPGSPAIDQGNAFGATTDQRGMPRIGDFQAITNAAGGDGSDIGAFEATAPPFKEPPPPKDTKDTSPPQTTIAKKPRRQSAQRLAKFRFSSSEPGSRFECKLDKGRFKPCANPFKRRVKPGKHRIEVRAIDKAGNADPTPARYAWRVVGG